jgi:signal transduction histidine kinase
MAEVVLTNNLTTEERTSLARFGDHNFLTPFATEVMLIKRHISKGTKLAEEDSHRLEAVYIMTRDLLNLISKDRVYLSQLGGENAIIKGYVERLVKYATSCYHYLPKKINAESKSRQRFLGNDMILLSLICNLATNGIKMGASELSILVEDQNEFPQTATFVPEGARDYSRFVAFRVHDNGKGFPQDNKEKWREYFTRCPARGEHGFGLYFTGLVAKVLRAPVEIQSVPGDTTVSFYQPVYVDLNADLNKDLSNRGEE